MIAEFNDLSIIGLLIFYSLAFLTPIYGFALLMLCTKIFSKNSLINLISLFFPNIDTHNKNTISHNFDNFFIASIATAVFPLAGIGIVFFEDEFPFPIGIWEKTGSLFSIFCWVLGLYSPVAFFQAITFGHACGWETVNC